MNEKELRKYLNVIKRAVAFIEAGLENKDGGLLELLTAEAPPVVPAVKADPPQVVRPVRRPEPQPVQEPQPQPVQPPQPVQEPPKAKATLITVSDEQMKAARKKHIGDLMGIDCWPEAVPSFLVAKDTSDEDQVNRANAVLDMMLDRNVEHLNFLDFGCGDGWIARQATKRGVKEAFGYDIKHSDNWAKMTGAKFTINFSELPVNFFDVVMLYDVLDHTEDPMGVMAQVRHVMKKDGSIYVRCHPWTSKHATHMYKQGINKAYLHMFLQYDEIMELIGQQPMFTRMEKNAMEAYRWWFHEFDIKKERIVPEPVSDFFHVPAFKELLANEQQIPMAEIDDFLKRMEIQFIDYVLTQKQ